MNIKDLIVILLILSVIFWGVFHQITSKYITHNQSLRNKIYGRSFYKSKSMDITDIELIITLVILINVINYFPGKSLENFFKKKFFNI